MALDLDAAQLHAADLAGDGLRQVGELQAANALERREPFAGKDKDVAGRAGVRLMAFGEKDISLGYGQPQRIR